MAEIELTNGGRALVDEADVVWLSRYTWWSYRRHHITDVEYAVTKIAISGRRYMVFMHRLIMAALPGDDVLIDHVNGDGLDNRRVNLRFTDRFGNARNRRGRRNSSSIYKGVARRKDKSTKPWRARIVAMVEGTRRWIPLGEFESEEEAAKAYDRAALQYHGRFARTNFPTEKAS